MNLIKTTVFFISILVTHLSQVSPSKASIEQVPGDLMINYVFAASTINQEGEEISILSIKDLGRCARVCSAWNRLTSQNNVWTKHYHQQFFLSFIPMDIYAPLPPLSTYRARIKGLDAYKKSLKDKAALLHEKNTCFPALHRSHEIIQQMQVFLNLPEDQRMKSLDVKHSLYIARECLYTFLATTLMGDRSAEETFLSNLNTFFFCSNEQGIEKSAQKNINDFFTYKGRSSNK